MNNCRALCHTIKGLEIGSKYKKPPPVANFPGGMGKPSLCAKCNGQTGAYYGEAFAEWTFQALEYAAKVGRENRIALPFRIKPLNVIKQILTMAIAAAAPGTSQAYGELRRFILNPFEQYVPGGFRVRAYLNPKRDGWDRDPMMMTLNRMTDTCMMLDIEQRGSVFILAEIAFPPMGYVVYFYDAKAKLTDQIAALADITHFGNHRVGREADLMVTLPVRSPFGPAPGNYAKN